MEQRECVAPSHSHYFVSDLRKLLEISCPAVNSELHMKNKAYSGSMSQQTVQTLASSQRYLPHLHQILEHSEFSTRYFVSLLQRTLRNSRNQLQSHECLACEDPWQFSIKTSRIDPPSLAQQGPYVINWSGLGRKVDGRQEDPVWRVSKTIKVQNP